MADDNLRPEIATAVETLTATMGRSGRQAMVFGRPQDAAEECMHLLGALLAEAQSRPDSEVATLVQAAAVIDRRITDTAIQRLQARIAQHAAGDRRRWNLFPRRAGVSRG